MSPATLNIGIRHVIICPSTIANNSSAVFFSHISSNTLLPLLGRITSKISCAVLNTQTHWFLPNIENLFHLHKLCLIFAFFFWCHCIRSAAFETRLTIAFTDAGVNLSANPESKKDVVFLKTPLNMNFRNITRTIIFNPNFPFNGDDCALVWKCVRNQTFLLWIYIQQLLNDGSGMFSTTRFKTCLSLRLWLLH